MTEEFNKGLMFDLRLTQLHPRLAKLPMIKEMTEGGVYKAHPSEPSLFTVYENGLNAYWLEWLEFSILRGVEFGDVFEGSPGWQPSKPLIDIGIGIRRLLIRRINDSDWVLPDKPPPIKTSNGRFISMAWVLDTARRDNMPFHEVTALGHSLVKE